jgi:hypothetical protein
MRDTVGRMVLSVMGATAMALGVLGLPGIPRSYSRVRTVPIAVAAVTSGGFLVRVALRGGAPGAQR